MTNWLEAAAELRRIDQIDLRERKALADAGLRLTEKMDRMRELKAMKARAIAEFARRWGFNEP